MVGSQERKTGCALLVRGVYSPCPVNHSVTSIYEITYVEEGG